jgi:hypothetical protein
MNRANTKNLFLCWYYRIEYAVLKFLENQSRINKLAKLTYGALLIFLTLSVIASHIALIPALLPITILLSVIAIAVPLFLLLAITTQSFLYTRDLAQQNIGFLVPALLESSLDADNRTPIFFKKLMQNLIFSEKEKDGFSALRSISYYKLFNKNIELLGLKDSLLAFCERHEATINSPTHQATVHSVSNDNLINPKEILAELLIVDQDLCFFVTENHTTFIDYIKTLAKCEITPSNSPTFAPLIFSIRKLEADLNAHVLSSLAIDQLKVIIKEKTKSYKLNTIQAVFPNYKERDQLDRNYLKFCQAEKDVLFINELLKELIEEKGKLSSSESIQLNINPNSNITNMSFMIIAPNKAFGYAIHHLLCMSKDAAQKDFSLYYTGQEIFILVSNEIQDLKNFLKRFEKFYQYSKLSLSSLLGPQITDAILTGQKLLSQLVKENDLKPVMSQNALNNLKHLSPHTVIPIFGSVAINLTDDPCAIESKTLLESLYENKGIKDHNDQPKKFIQIPESVNSMTLMTEIDFEQISGELVNLEKMSLLAEEMGYASIAAPEFIEARSLHSLPYALLKEKLWSIINVSRGDVIFCTELSEQLSEELSNVLFFFIEGESTNSLNNRYKEALLSIMDRLMTVSLDPDSHTTRELNPEELKALLPSDRPNLELLRPDSDQDINFLLNQLKTSPAYKKANTSFETHRQRIFADSHRNLDLDSLDNLIKKLSTAFINRRVQSQQISTSNSQYYGRKPFIRCEQSLFEIVSTIYYQERLGISEQSILNSFISLAQSFYTPADINSCTDGFSGRLADALALLYVEQNNPIMRAAFALRAEVAERAYRTKIIAQGTETSSRARLKPYLYSIVGLHTGEIDEATLEDSFDLFNQMKNDFKTEFLRQYTPSLIYQTCFETVLANFKTLMSDHGLKSANKAVASEKGEQQEGIYTLLAELNFIDSSGGLLSAEEKSELDKFRVDLDDNRSKWSLAKIENELPTALIKTLKKLNLCQESDLKSHTHLLSVAAQTDNASDFGGGSSSFGNRPSSFGGGSSSSGNRSSSFGGGSSSSPLFFSTLSFLSSNNEEFHRFLNREQPRRN